MGTTYVVKLARPPQGLAAAKVQAAIDEVLAHIDATMSGYREDSEISRFNAAQTTDWIPVSEDLAHIVQVAHELSAASGGAFDVTVAPLVQAWGFGSNGEPVSLPDGPTLASIGERIGYEKLHVRTEPAALRKDVASLSVDLNAIAPGYAVDLIGERLEALAIRDFMIDLGGEVLAKGRNAQGVFWRIAIERPVDAEPEPYAIVELRNDAVTTSGEYRHYHVRDGRRYSHTIDPRTSMPIEHDLAAVVVLGPTSMYTDGWATAFNVLGTQAGHALALERQMAVMFIDCIDGRLHPRATAQFQARIVRPVAETIAPGSSGQSRTCGTGRGS